MKNLFLLSAFLVALFSAENTWAGKERIVCHNNGVTMTVDAGKNQSFVTRKKGKKQVTKLYSAIRKTQNQKLNDQRTSVFILANKTRLEISFSKTASGYGVLTSGQTGRMYDMGSCVRL